ncbi:MAG: hypothetical protein JXR46_05790 [Calditrichaceae bacterium]|nr:hypothetical protein [Calditrichaceae bacterium]MBN2708536.1 hypothetical protein [Calditrichaceae bacterium]RQV93491.1 MAG: hypothetical protein EH224_12400 [Calditrichota bacterium]
MKKYQKNIFYFFSAAILFFNGTGLLLADELELIRVSTKQGLSQSTITSICQDSSGFLWFGTYDGLNRYDGYKFKVFKHDPLNPNSLSQNYIRSLCTDKEGNLWIGTTDGLNVFDPVTEHFIVFRNNPQDSTTLGHNLISTLFADSRGRLWIGTSTGGLSMLNLPSVYAQEQQRPENRKYLFRNFKNTDAGIKNEIWNRITDIYEDRSGNIWICTRHGLTKLDPEKEVFINYLSDPGNPNTLNSSNITSVAEDKNGHLWIATWENGLNQYIPEENRFIRYPFMNGSPGGPSHQVNMTLLRDMRGDIWVGTWGGGINKIISRRNSSGKKNTVCEFIHYDNNPKDIFSIHDLLIFSIYEDHSGIIWFGSEWNGLFKYRPGYGFKHIHQGSPAPYSLNQNNVFDIYKDKDDLLWIGTRNGGINLFDCKNNTSQYMMNKTENPASISHNIVRVIIEDSDGLLWIGTEIGLECYDRRNKKFIHYFIDRENPYLTNIFCLTEDRYKNLWIGTYGHGLYRFEKKNNSIKRYLPDLNDPDAIGHHTIWKILEDRKGHLWIATDNGGLNLYDYENDRFIKYTMNLDNPSGLRGNKILTIFEDSKGRIWLGTTSGLTKMVSFGGRETSPEFIHYTVEDGLPTNTIHGILEDDHGNLWISTNNGLSKFDPDRKTFINFNEGDGLQDKEFSVNACYKDIVSGEFYFGGINGYNVFHPDSISLNKIKPKVVLTNLRIFNQNIDIGQEINGEIPLKKSITLTDELWISYFFDNFTIEFSALHFIAPENNQYAYKLEGFEDNWHFVNWEQRTATYTNLDPGRYVFHVNASNNAGVWNEEGAKLTLNIIPPFWATWWFRILLIILIALVIVFIIRYRTRLILKRNRELEQRVAERTKEMAVINNELEAFTYSVSHDLRTPLRGMNGFSEALLEDYSGKLDEKGKEYLNRIRNASHQMGSLIDELLKLSRLSRAELKYENVNLSDIVQTILNTYKQNNPDRSVVFKVAPSILTFADKGLTEIMLQNLLDNAWKFTSKKEITEIEFGERMINSKKYCFIKDNGVGLETRYAEKLFEVFQRQQPEYEGTGLGLAIVKRVVNRHSGEIWARGKLNRSATFYFRFGEK